MFDESVRTRFSRVAQPLVSVLTRTGVTPDQMTVVTFVVAVSGAALIALGHPHAGLVVWLISRLGDGLDGALARASARPTPFGAYLDITLDMAAYSAMVLAFSRLYPSLATAWAAILAAYVVVITTTLALSDAAGAADRHISQTDRTFRFTPGIAEAGETTLMYILWVVLPGYVEWLAWTWVFALIATGVQRTVLARRVLR